MDPSEYTQSGVSPSSDPSALPGFEKANEIFFRLGIIYKQQRKSAQSLEVSSDGANHLPHN